MGPVAKVLLENRVHYYWDWPWPMGQRPMASRPRNTHLILKINHLGPHGPIGPSGPIGHWPKGPGAIIGHWAFRPIWPIRPDREIVYSWDVHLGQGPNRANRPYGP